MRITLPSHYCRVSCIFSEYSRLLNTLTRILLKLVSLGQRSMSQWCPFHFFFNLYWSLLTFPLQSLVPWGSIVNHSPGVGDGHLLKMSASGSEGQRSYPRQQPLVQPSKRWIIQSQTNSWIFFHCLPSCLSNESLNQGPELIALVVPAGFFPLV